MVEVRRVGAEDWELVRDVRLRALTDSPEAFCSTYEREAAFAQEDWLARFGNSDTFVAFDGDKPVGLVSGVHHDVGRHELVGMWVAPEVRGSDAASSLVEALLERARGGGVDTVTLWIMDGNGRGLRFYERVGFRLTGRREPSRPGSDTEMAEMQRPLAVTAPPGEPAR